MRKHTITIAAALLLVTTAQPVSALTRTSATWTQLASGPQVAWATTAFEPKTCRVVHLGGSTGYQLSTRTSIFDPATNAWTTLPTPRVGPTVYTSAAMAWDPAIQRLVLFGGRGNRGPSQETWAFDPVTHAWSLLLTKCRTGACPPARYAHGMVWSSRINRLIVFGGMANESTLLDDVWTFGGTWTKVSVAGPRPSARGIFGFAEDPTTGSIVLYGGWAWNESVNDTWLLDPTTMEWTHLTTAANPTGLAETAVGWSPFIGAVVAFGGSDRLQQTAPNPGTWALDQAARTWVRLSTDVEPSARIEAALVTDTCRGNALLIGGSTNAIPITTTDRTWVLR